MGISTYSILAYGYDLGPAFGYDDDDLSEPIWYLEDEGWQESMEIALLAAVGFTEDWFVSNDGYFERKSMMEKRMGVTVVPYGSSDDSMYLLAAKYQTSRWNADPIDITVPDNANERLAWALDVLALKPKITKPQWLLTSYRG